MPETCAFCEGPGPLTREHVWPQRFEKYLGSGEAIYLYERKVDHKPPSPSWTADKLDAKARAVCKECNEGWMERLDDEAESIVAALMRGISVSLEAQELLVRWALKVTYMTEYLGESKGRAVPQAHRSGLRLGNLPPDTYLWVARYKGQHVGLHRIRTFNIFDAVPGVEGDDTEHVLAGEGYMLAFTIDQFAIRVLGYPDIVARPLQPESVAVDWEAQLLPQVLHTVVLPPQRFLRDADWRDFTNRLPASSWSS